MAYSLRSNAVKIHDVIDDYRGRLPAASAGALAAAIIDDDAVPDDFHRGATYRALVRVVGDYFRGEDTGGLPRRVPTGERDEHGLIQIELPLASFDHWVEGGIVKAQNELAVSTKLLRYVEFARARFGDRFPDISALRERARARGRGDIDGDEQ